MHSGWTLDLLLGGFCLRLGLESQDTTTIDEDHRHEGLHVRSVQGDCWNQFYLRQQVGEN